MDSSLEDLKKCLWVAKQNEEATHLANKRMAACLFEAEEQIDVLRGALDARQVVAWDILEARIYGVPGETRHRVLWVDEYTQPDGSTPDLDDLLDAAQKQGGIDGGGRTISIRPMFYGPGIEIHTPEVAS